MASLYVSEYRQLASVPSATNYAPMSAQAPQEPPLAEYVVNIAGSSTASQLFGQYTALLRVNCDATCSIAIGFNPTATTTNKRLATNQTEFFGVSPGQQIAVISNA
jgi:hypothetical protein